MGGLRRIAAYVDAVSETWIGWPRPPVQLALEEAQWQADTRADYCGRCGGSVGPGEANDNGCAACRDGSALGDGFVRLDRYDGPMREWVLALKYTQWAAMGDLLGRRLGEAVDAAGVVEADRTVVVPMPMPWQRRLYRGIDHARVVAAAVAEQLDAPLARPLGRSNGPPLLTLSATERAALGGRGMYLRRRLGGWPLDGLHVLVVDDVRTSGASLRAAIRLLRQLKPQKVAAAVLAVADEAARGGNRVNRTALDDVENRLAAV